MEITIRVLRQDGPNTSGYYVRYHLDGVTDDTRLLDALRALNDRLVHEGIPEIAYARSCVGGGVCGSCGMMINGRMDTTYGAPEERKTFCKLLMHEVLPTKKDAVLTLEPLPHFPILRDLVVDKSIMNKFTVLLPIGEVGSAPSVRSRKTDPIENAWAQLGNSCTGCGRCIAACPNSSAALFFAAGVVHKTATPAGKIGLEESILESEKVLSDLDYGRCSNHGVCQYVCPVDMTKEGIGRMRRTYASMWAKKKL